MNAYKMRNKYRRDDSHDKQSLDLDKTMMVQRKLPAQFVAVSIHGDFFKEIGRASPASIVLFNRISLCFDKLPHKMMTDNSFPTNKKNGH